MGKRTKRKAREIEKDNIKNRRRLLKIIGGAVLLATGVAGTRCTLDRLEDLAKIAFEEAVQGDDETRQQYLEQVTAHHIEMFEKEYGQDMVEGITYDPDLKKLNLKLAEILNKTDAPLEKEVVIKAIEANKSYANRKSNERAHATTMQNSFPAFNGNSTIYFHKGAFDPEAVVSEEEFLSLLDHELGHVLTHKIGLRFDIEACKKYGLSTDNSENALTNAAVRSTDAYNEALAYDFQLRIIREGKRNVSDRFTRGKEIEYRKNLEIIKEFADMNDNSLDSRAAKAMLETLGFRQ